MSKITLFTVIMGFFLNQIAHADVDSRLSKAIDGFKSDPQVSESIENLKSEGWRVSEPTGAMVHSLWTDEGTQGIYLVSL